MSSRILERMRKTAAAGCRRFLERPLYSAGIAAYGVGVRVASVSNAKARLLEHGQHEWQQKLRAAIGSGEHWIWIHAASLGEFEQGRPIIERIRAERPEFRILLTFFSPSGYEVRKNYGGADCVCYLPFDTPGRVRRFLDIARPEMAIFVKYEFWRNYLEALYKRNIPVYLISAVFRPEQFFFKKRSAWYGRWLDWYTRIFVQDERSRRLLAGIGIDRVEVCGDTRFDRVADIRSTRKPIPVLERFVKEGTSGRPAVMMAGSSWPADEDVYSAWFNAHPEVKLVIAPHEFDAGRLETLRARFGSDAVLMSEAVKNPELADTVRVMIMDCFGLLSSSYAYCDVAYVGGGFGAGLHNINEAAVYDVPVIYGPNNAKFIEAREMAESGGGLPVGCKADFEREADRLFLAPDAAETRRKLGQAAGDYIRGKLGATDRIFRRIFG